MHKQNYKRMNFKHFQLALNRHKLMSLAEQKMLYHACNKVRLKQR